MLECVRMLAPLKLFATKLAIFSTVLLYLALDLWAFHGPVWKLVHEKVLPHDAGNPTIATLYGERIRQSDWDAHEKELAFAQGIDQMPESAHATVLMSLLRSSLLPLRLNYNDNNVPRFEKEAEAELKRLASRAKSPEEWASFLRAHDLTEKELQDIIETRLRECFLIKRSITHSEELSEEDVARYYELVKEELRIPASRQVSHIFLRSLGRDEAQLQQHAELVLANLNAGGSFASVADEYSHDLASSAKGGDLGIIYEGARMPLPELALFGDDAIEPDTPTLVKSRWGWHILLAAPIEPSRIPELDEVKDSLRSAILSARRAWAVDAYFETSFKSLFKENFLHIYER